ncbi:hypothetical protein ILUMI_07098, partial [Ignelater luminosus]
TEAKICDRLSSAPSSISKKLHNVFEDIDLKNNEPTYGPLTVVEDGDYFPSPCENSTYADLTLVATVSPHTDTENQQKIVAIGEGSLENHCEDARSHSGNRNNVANIETVTLRPKPPREGKKTKTEEESRKQKRNDWANLVQLTQRKPPTIVTELDQKVFVNFKSFLPKTLIHRKKNSFGKPVQWPKIKWTQYTTDAPGIFNYKETVDKSQPFKILDLTRTTNKKSSLPTLEQINTQPLPQAKKSWTI